MSSTNATTTDGFRVGRRVRVTGDCYMDREGELRRKAGGTDSRTWEIQLDGMMATVFGLVTDLELLPDDEPDAPATPEPDHFADAGKMVEPAPAVAYDPREPETVASGKPSYYAKLRDAGCEPFAVIAACLPLAKAIAYHQATAIAYLIRAEHKHETPDDDIRKAHAHLAEAVRLMDGRTA